MRYTARVANVIVNHETGYSPMLLVRIPKINDVAAINSLDGMLLDLSPVS